MNCTPARNLGRAVTLDQSLDRDLGFDSLSRMELFHRAEREFAVTLTDRALAQIETPRDLLRELNSADGRRALGLPPTAFDFDPAPAASPEPAATLNEVLAWHAERHGTRPHIRLFRDGAEDQVITYGDLFDEAGEIAGGLLAHDLQPGESVLIMLATGRDYFRSFFGILLAGGVPVPVYPPGRPQQLEEHLLRHADIATTALAGLMITEAEAVRFAKLMAPRVPTLRAVVTADQLATRPAPPPPCLAPPPPTRPFCSSRSGSTGDPKGVVLSHANLLANIRAMGRALDVTAEDVFVSWLPLYHDMGLIGAWLGSLTFAVPLVIMSPLSFLARPERWLRAISDYGGTISGAPNFAYDACVKRIRDEDLAGLDLSSWRIAFNGAEAVSPPTLDRFAARF